jgi:hypothetical protein
MSDEKPEMVKLWAVALVGRDGEWVLAGASGSDPKTIEEEWHLGADNGVFAVRRYLLDLEVPRPPEPDWLEVSYAAIDLSNSFELVQQPECIKQARRLIAGLDGADRGAIRKLLDEIEPPHQPPHSSEGAS